MKRRDALRQTALLVGGMVLLPAACRQKPREVAAAVDLLQLTAEQQQLLAQVVEAMIPSDAGPGGATLALHAFVLVMVKDCEPADQQQIFARGLQLLPAVGRQLDRPFPAATPAAGQAALRDLMVADAGGDASDTDQEMVRAFLAITKRHAVRGFMTSQYVLTDVFPYQLVPGNYRGCVSTTDLPVM